MAREAGPHRLSHQPFDIRPLAGATLDDLNLPFLREQYAAEKGSDREAGTYPGFEAWLGQRDLARKSMGEWTPTAAGLLLFGVAPQRHIAGATIEFVRYAGRDFEAPVVSRKSILGTLPDQLEALWTQLTANVTESPAGASGIREAFVPDYPLDALKELARNLVQHRLYEGTNAPGRVSWLEDRIVFSNPGSPFGQASEGELGAHSDYRNPTITRGLVELGYVQRLGRGIRLARSHLARNGNPPLEVERDGFTTVIVRWRP